MSLKNFVAALFPSTESSRLRTLLENSYTSIEKSILPSLQYDDSAVAKTGLYITVDRNLKGTFGPDGYKGDLVKYLRNTMVFMLKERSKVLDIYEKSFSKTIETAALDYKKAYLMEYVAGVVFFADYVSKLSYALTSIAVNDNYKKQGIEDEYVQECTDASHMRIFATMCNVLNTKTSAFGEALDAMKDISFDVRTDETMQKAYGGKLNPMKMGYMPVVSDIAIIFGEAYNYVYKAIFDYHKDRYEASKMNILYLERKKAGASAEELAAIEKQLTYYRAQLQKHEERMEAMKNGA